jgi:hypothetical protein
MFCAALVVCATASAARSERHSLVASEAGVTARLSWSGEQWGFLGNPRIAIWRHGQLVAERPVPSAWGECARGCVERVSWSDALLVRDLDGDGEPEVVLNLYGGGAHCCSISQIYRYTDGRYVGRRTTWEADYRLRDYDRDGVLEFSSADRRFCFGCSYPLLAEPVRIWHYRHGAFEDVTRSFPGPVSYYARLDRREVHEITAGRDAYRDFTRSELNKFAGVYLARYVAETCLLDQCIRGWRFAQARAGEQYLRRLHRYLVRLDYWR